MKKVLIVAALVAALVSAGAAGAAPGPRYKWNSYDRKTVYAQMLSSGYSVKAANCIDKYVPYYMNTTRQNAFHMQLVWADGGFSKNSKLPHWLPVLATSQLKSDVFALAQQCRVIWSWEDSWEQDS